MNVKEAKKQIKNAAIAYFTKDEFSHYLIPMEKQRPVFLMGAPGIGKTAIMEQIAQEMDLPLVSYSMTHHTRQSALGLPFISHKVYGGKEYDVSEYTMSEIIATIYEMMEQTGKKEGILFLDEINCVSETLSPVMLQFLQYKVFGKHHVPEGWIVVTAGNPPEYNNSVREFDIVTWDRLKRIDVEPDYNCWKEYAFNAGVHPAITTYLDIKTDHFYKVESTVGGKTFVTARGWEDLSKMIRLYEQNGICVDENLIGQYLQNKQISKEFAIYYDLFNKYRNDYQVDRILEGKATEEIRRRAEKAKFDERLSLLGLLLDAISMETEHVIQREEFITDYMLLLKEFKSKSVQSGFDARTFLEGLISNQMSLIERSDAAGTLNETVRKKRLSLISSFETLITLTTACASGKEAFAIVKEEFNKDVDGLNELASKTRSHLDNIFAFCEAAFHEGQELLILVTELTINVTNAKFISKYGCDAYFRHNKELLLYERQKEIIREIEDLSLED